MKQCWISVQAGGIDVLLSAQRVGPAGKAYGLDMSDEMLALARENQKKAGLTNVEFLNGTIENIPLPDNSVDVIISNCVINLSGDKDRVLREAFRVLKPDGRFAISDVVVRGEVPAEIRKSMELWVGCIAGALEEYEYRDKLFGAGFNSIEIEPTRIYRSEEARDFLTAAGLDADKVGPVIDGKFISAFVRAIKPAGLGTVVGLLAEAEAYSERTMAPKPSDLPSKKSSEAEEIADKPKAQHSRETPDVMQKCECPPGCVGLPCCT